jgi:hypothetical protein
MRFNDVIKIKYFLGIPFVVYFVLMQVWGFYQVVKCPYNVQGLDEYSKFFCEGIYVLFIPVSFFIGYLSYRRYKKKND